MKNVISAIYIFIFSVAVAQICSAQKPDIYTIIDETANPKAVAITEKAFEQSYKELVSYFNFEIRNKIVIRIVGSDESFRKYFNKPYYKKVLGIAFPEHCEIILKSPATLIFGVADYRAVIAHELCHIFLAAITRNANVPLWLHEGLAMHFEPVWYWNSFPSLVLPAAYLSGNLIPFGAISQSFPPNEKMIQTAYAQSRDFVSFLIRSYGMDKISALLEKLAGNTDINSALILVYSDNLQGLEQAWFLDMKKKYSWVYLFGQANFFWFAVSVCAIIGFILMKIRRKNAVKNMEYGEPDNLGNESIDEPEKNETT